MIVGMDIERLIGKQQRDAPEQSPSYTLAELAKLAERWAIEDKILATDRWLVSSLIAWLAKKEREGNGADIR